MEKQYEIARLLRLRKMAAQLQFWDDYVAYTKELNELGYKEEN
jgi:hypothetical protein